MVDVVRVDENDYVQKYHMNVGTGRCWDIVYVPLFRVPKEDKEISEVNEMLLLQGGYPTFSYFGGGKGSSYDIVSLCGEEVGLGFPNRAVHDSVFGRWDLIGTCFKDRMLKVFSNEARSLLEKGIEYYWDLHKT